MPTPSFYRLYLMKDATNYYYIDSSGLISTTTDESKARLNYAPWEWEKIKRTYQRSDTYHGIFQQYSDEYTFSGDGQKILSYIWATQCYIGTCIFMVTERDSIDWSIYKPFINNYVYFVTPVRDNTSIKIKLFENGLVTDLKANDGVDYSIRIEDADCLNLTSEGTTLKVQYNFRLSDSHIYVSNLHSISGSVINTGLWFNMLTIHTNDDGTIPIATAQTSYSNNGMGYFPNDYFEAITSANGAPYQYFDLQSFQDSFRVDELDYITKLNWLPRGLTVGTTVGFSLWAVKSQMDTAPFTDGRTLLYNSSLKTITSTATTFTEVINISSFIGDLSNKECLYIVGAFDSSVAGGDFDVWIDTADALVSSVTLKAHFDSATSIIKGYRIYQIYQKLIQHIAAGKYGPFPAISTFLSDPSSYDSNVYLYRMFMTCMNQVRGITNSTIKMQFGDFWKDLTSRHAVGLVVTNNQTNIVPLSVIYDPTNIIFELGQLTDCKFSQNTKGIGTTLSFGAKVDITDKLNGQDDYNTTSKWKGLPLLDKAVEMDYTSPFTDSMYNIEAIRVDTSGRDTTATTSDNNIAVIYCDETISGVTKIHYCARDLGHGVPTGVVTGVYYPHRAYNVELSPAQNIKRLMPIINSNCFPITAQFDYLNSLYNDQMTAQCLQPDGVTLSPVFTENSPIVPNTLDTRILWLPYDIEAESIVPLNIDDIFAANPYGGVAHGIWKGIDVYWFVDSVDNTPEHRDTFTWTGRLTPNNDLVKLLA